MLTSTHKPSDIRIFHKEAKTLANQHDVAVIAPDDDLRELHQSGVRVITVKKAKNKVFHFLTLWRVFKAALRQKWDIIHCHEPDSLVVGLFLRSLKGGKVVYDVHEHWPSEISYGWLKVKRSRSIKKVIEGLSWFIEGGMAKLSDCVIAVSNSVAERFRRDGVNVVIIPNVPFLPETLPKGRKDCDIVLMGGGLQEYHGVKELFSAFVEVKGIVPAVSLKVIGDVKMDIGKLLLELGIKNNVILTGYLDLDKMYSEIGKGRLGVVLFKAEFHNAYLGLPNKLFDYMLCGLPVIASDFPEIRRVVSSVKSGILVDPENVNEIARAIVYLLENPAKAKKMGIRGRRLIERRMNWSKIGSVLTEAYRTIRPSNPFIPFRIPDQKLLSREGR